MSDRVQANIARDQLEKERLDLFRARERAAHLIARSNAKGVFWAPRAGDLPGRYFRKGELLAYVMETGQPTARVVVTQGEVDLVRLATRQVEVRLAHRISAVLQATVVRQVPAGVEELPSRALSTEGGGHVPLDPREPKGSKAMNRLFQFDLEFADPNFARLFGGRVFVRFNHEMEPLAMQWYRNVRQLFLARFNV